jgi:hypothetical protein
MQNRSLPHAPYSNNLCLWIGNKSYSLETFGKDWQKIRRLTRLELEWLAFELSNWLNLPIQKTETATPASDSNSHSAEASSEENLPVSSVSSYPLSKINRPANANCSINKKIAEKIVITAPRAWYWSFPGIRCLLGILLYILLVLSGTIDLVGAITLMFVLLICLVFTVGHTLHIAENKATKKIVLSIDRYKIALWQQSQSWQWHCIKKMNRSMIRKLKLMYKETSYQQYCHVLICSDNSGITEDNFIVGNRKFWLSRKEAEWLASELSDWLQMPVTEVEVVETAA